MTLIMRIGTVSLCLLASTLAFAADTTKKPNSSAQTKSDGPALGVVGTHPPRPIPQVAAAIPSTPTAHIAASTSGGSYRGWRGTLNSFATRSFAAGASLVRRIGNLFFSKPAGSVDETDEYGASASGTAGTPEADEAPEQAAPQVPPRKKPARQRAQSIIVPRPSKKVELELPHRSADAYDTYSTNSSDEPYTPVEASAPPLPMPHSPDMQPSAPPLPKFKQPTQEASELKQKLKEAVDKAESAGRVNIDSSRSEVEHADQIVTAAVNGVEGLRSKHGLTRPIERALEQLKQILRGIEHVRRGLKQPISKAIPKSRNNERRFSPSSSASRFHRHAIGRTSPLPDSILLDGDDFKIVSGRLIIRPVLAVSQLDRLTAAFNSGEFVQLTEFEAMKFLGHGEGHHRSFRAFLKSLRKAPHLSKVVINRNEFTSEYITLLIRSLPKVTRLDLRHNKFEELNPSNNKLEQMKENVISEIITSHVREKQLLLITNSIECVLEVHTADGVEEGDTLRRTNSAVYADKPLPTSIALDGDGFEITNGKLTIQSVLTVSQLDQLTDMFNRGEFTQLDSFVASEFLGCGEGHHRSFGAFINSLRMAPHLSNVLINRNQFTRSPIESVIDSTSDEDDDDERDSLFDSCSTKSSLSSSFLEPDEEDMTFMMFHVTIENRVAIVKNFPFITLNEFSNFYMLAKDISGVYSVRFSECTLAGNDIADAESLHTIFGQHDLVNRETETTIAELKQTFDELIKRSWKPNLRAQFTRVRSLLVTKIREMLAAAKPDPEEMLAESRLNAARMMLNRLNRNSTINKLVKLIECPQIARDLSKEQKLNTEDVINNGFRDIADDIEQQLGEQAWSAIQAEALRAINRCDFTHFDPLVRDTSCELRALFGLYVYHRLASKSKDELTDTDKEDLDLSTLIYILSHAVDTKYDEDGFGANDQKNDKKKLSEFLTEFDSQNELSSSKTCKLIPALERAVAYGSVAFARRLSLELGGPVCDALRSVYTKQCIFDDDEHKRPVVPCYGNCVLELEFACSYDIPLVFRTRLGRSTDAPSMGTVIAVYVFNGKSFVAVNPTTIDDRIPVLVADAVTTRFDFRGDVSPDADEVRRYIAELDLLAVWLSGAAAHPPFAGQNKYIRLTESPTSELVLGELRSLYDYSRREGTCRENRYTQFVVHSYVTTLRQALQYGGGHADEMSGIAPMLLENALYYRVRIVGRVEKQRLLHEATAGEET